MGARVSSPPGGTKINRGLFFAFLFGREPSRPGGGPFGWISGRKTGTRPRIGCRGGEGAIALAAIRPFGLALVHDGDFDWDKS